MSEQQNDQLTVWRKGAASIIDVMKTQWSKVLPTVCTPERFARVALSCLSKNPTLLEALQTQQGKADIMSAFMTCAEMGIEPDGRRAHLIPYKNKKNNTFNISLIFDYKGLVELAMRSGKIANIHTDKVYKQDVFVYNKGRLETHIPNWDVDTEKEKPYLYYCNVVFKDGSEVCEVMRVSEIEGIKKRSNAWRAYEKYGVTCPWVTDYDEMAKKTTFRRVSKWLPLSPEVLDAFDKDDEADKAIVIDAEPKKSRFSKASSLEEQMANQPKKPESEGKEPAIDIEAQNKELQTAAEEQKDEEIPPIGDLFK